MIIHLNRPLPDSDVIEINSEFWEYYLTTVRRFQPGDSLEVAGRDRVASSEVLATEPLTLAVQSTRPARKPGHDLVLLQSLTRKKKFEEAVRLGTELGVTRFVPLVSERTVREPNNPGKQRRRWRKIALDSTRVTGRDWAPDVEELQPLEEALSTDTAGELYLGSERGDAPGTVFEAASDRASLFVGPEGGFTEAEVKTILSAGARRVSLGSQNYRAETASLVLSTLWLDRRGCFQSREDSAS